MVTYEGINLTHSLTSEGHVSGVAALQAYFAPPPGAKEGFTGGAWDTFDPSGTRAASSTTFTADDVLSCTLLSTPVPARAALELLVNQRRRFEVMLEDLGPDRDFVDLPSTKGEVFGAVRRLYAALDDLPGVGETRATKLLARKRPRLVPIIDSVVKAAAFANAKTQWEPLHAALVAQNGRLWDLLIARRSAANLSLAVSPLRIFDVLTWMDATGNTERVMRGHGIQPGPEAATSPGGDLD